MLTKNLKEFGSQEGIYGQSIPMFFFFLTKSIIFNEDASFSWQSLLFWYKDMEVNPIKVQEFHYGEQLYLLSCSTGQFLTNHPFTSYLFPEKLRYWGNVLLYSSILQI